MTLKIRIAFGCSLLGFAAALWVLLRLTSPLAGQEMPAPAVDRLQGVTRLCIEDFEGGENARQLRAILIGELQKTQAFVITENPARADAFLRGFAEDLVYTEQHARDEAVGGRSAGNLATGGNSRNRRAIGASAGVNESVRERSTERRHEASLSVRIVNAEGDVLWSATAESRGGKYRSAAADVCTKIAGDLQKALKGTGAKKKTEVAPRAGAVKDSAD